MQTYVEEACLSLIDIKSWNILLSFGPLEMNQKYNMTISYFHVLMIIVIIICYYDKSFEVNVFKLPDDSSFYSFSFRDIVWKVCV